MDGGYRTEGFLLLAFTKKSRSRMHNNNVRMHVTILAIEFTDHNPLTNPFVFVFIEDRRNYVSINVLKEFWMICSFQEKRSFGEE